MEKREKLIALSHEVHGDWLKIYEVLQKDPKLEGWQPSEKVKTTKVVTIFDDAYPASFLELDMPPFVIYYEGELGLAKEAFAGIIGNYTPSPYGIEYSQKIFRDQLAGAVVDYGIGAKVLAAGRGRIGFLPCGIDSFSSQPLGNLLDSLKEKGLLISESPPGTPFSWRRYFRACRLLAGLSECLVVLELEKEDRRLGMIEANLVAGLPVFVLTDRFDAFKSKGGLNILAKGAMPAPAEFF